MTITFDFFTADVLLWAGTDRERVSLGERCSRERRNGRRASDATLRRFMHKGAKYAGVPIRVLRIVRHDGGTQ